MVGAKKIVGAGNPLVQIFLQEPARHHARLGNALQASVAGAHVERLFAQHVAHGAAHRRKGGIFQHLQLEFAVAVNEIGVGKKIEPVVNRLVERAQQALALKGAALQHLLRFHFAGVAKVFDKQRAHLPAMAHLFDHHPGQGAPVVIRGRRFKQEALLLATGKLGVALIDDQIQQRVAHVLRGHAPQVFPLALSFVVAKLDLFGLDLAVQGLELEGIDVAVIDADLFAPLLEQSDPVAEGPDFKS